MRFVAYLLGIAAIVAVFCLPALFFDIPTGGSEGYEPTSISRYDASFVMNDQGDLAVTEDIDVDVSTGDRHGIFRFFDREDPNAPHARRTPEDISVTREGAPEPFDKGTEHLGRYTVLKIGDADRYLSQGTHHYTIKYIIDGTLLKAEGGGSAFYWNLVPGGWQQDISNVNLSVRLPVAAAQTVRCTVGWGEGRSCASVQGAGTQQLSIHVDSVPAQTPVTVITDLDMVTPPEGNHVPWSIRWDAVLGTHTVGLAVVVLLGVGGALLGGHLGSKAREREPGFPLTYAPPPGITPAQGNYILTERLPRHAYVATLLQAAQQGSVQLSRDGKDWTITDAGKAHDPADLAAVTAARLTGGASFTASKKSVSAGKQLQSNIATFNSDVKKWAISAGLLSRTGLGGLGIVLVLGGLVLAAVCLFVRPFGMSMFGIVPGAFAIFGSSMAAAGAGTRRTATGRQMWSRLGGFKRVLSTPSSKQRFDFSGREELYTAYIPWAVAFDCAAEWAAKYRTEMGSEPPAPAYFGAAYVGAHSGDFASSMVHDFDSTLSGAISAYSASQSHSSGGGGFSGGGGGGGGGGGSW